MNTAYTRQQKINIHYYSLLKCGAEPTSLYGSTSGFHEYYNKQSDKVLDETNEIDAQHLAEIGLTIDDIVRIYMN